MAAVPRHHFVDSALVDQAYEDTSLPIGLGQTISKPSVVARMLELLLAARTRARSGTLGRVLEIGTGCGYQAAVLARLATQRGLDRAAAAAARQGARATCAAARGRQLRLVYGDGALGHAPNAPYDGIIAAAGGDDAARGLARAARGRRAPGRADARRRGAAARCWWWSTAANGLVQRRVHEAVHFVPLKSGIA